MFPGLSRCHTLDAALLLRLRRAATMKPTKPAARSALTSFHFIPRLTELGSPRLKQRCSGRPVESGIGQHKGHALMPTIRCLHLAGMPTSSTRRRPEIGSRQREGPCDDDENRIPAEGSCDRRRCAARRRATRLSARQTPGLQSTSASIDLGGVVAGKAGRSRRLVIAGPPSCHAIRQDRRHQRSGDAISSQISPRPITMSRCAATTRRLRTGRTRRRRRSLTCSRIAAPDPAPRRDIIRRSTGFRC